MPFVSEMLSCAISLLQFIYLVLCNAWALQGREFLMLQTAESLTFLPFILYQCCNLYALSYL